MALTPNLEAHRNTAAEGIPIPQNAEWGACIEINAGHDGTVPDKIHLLPSGPKVKGRDGRSFTLDDAAGVVKRFKRNGADLPLDIEHATVLQAPYGMAAPAMAWITDVKIERTGLWGTVEWNSAGHELVADRSYRYISPVIITDGTEDKNVLALHSAALTNTPNLKLKALNRQGADLDDDDDTMIHQRFTVGASRNLPIVDRSWDGSAAKARIFALPQRRWRNAFLIFDADAPDLRGSYKLPFADVVNSTLSAITAGVRAAAQRLPQTDAPGSVRDRARGVIDQYQRRIRRRARNSGETAMNEEQLRMIGLGPDATEAEITARLVERNAAIPTTPAAAAPQSGSVDPSQFVTRAEYNSQVTRANTAEAAVTATTKATADASIDTLVDIASTDGTHAHSSKLTPLQATQAREHYKQHGGTEALEAFLTASPKIAIDVNFAQRDQQLAAQTGVRGANGLTHGESHVARLMGQNAEKYSTGRML